MILYTKEGTRIENYCKMCSGLTHCGVCEYCGDSFKSRSPRAKYCSSRCKNDAYLQRRKIQKNLERQKKCAVCGKSYVAKKNDSMYCSNACKQKAYRTKKNVTNIRFAKIGTTDISNNKNQEEYKI